LVDKGNGQVLDLSHQDFHICKPPSVTLSL
jgi:hypothetical protein